MISKDSALIPGKVSGLVKIQELTEKRNLIILDISREIKRPCSNGKEYEIKVSRIQNLKRSACAIADELYVIGVEIPQCA